MLPDDDWVPPMDHAPGWKASAFSWDMGRLILARVAAGETVKAITADPRMPSYCTVYRWTKVIPAFGDKWWALRERMAGDYVRAQDTRRAALAFWAPRNAAAAGKRWWRRGKPPSYTAAVGEAICARIRGGETMMAINADPAMPSAKVVYTWMRKEPEFRDRVIEARRWRLGWLEFHAENVADLVGPGNLSAIKRRVARIEGRIGRETPKRYRVTP